MDNPGLDRPASSSGPDVSKDDLDQLRDLLLGPERAYLGEFRDYIRNRSQRAIDVSEVLPDAILLRAGRDARLMQTLQPLLEKALAESVRRDPRVLAEALFPIIAGAVRRAVASALEGMVETLNQAVETSISVRSFRWRIEAARTGKSYAEIALLRSLLYRVEQVFLIQNKTGLLLQYVTGYSVESRDPDMISGMLTAIQNFVQDSFGAAEDTLETVRVGEFSIWIQHGPKALLAAVIRGTPPVKLREVFDSALDNIHHDFAVPLQEFQGNAANLEGARPALESCLLGKSPPGRRPSRKPVYGAGMVLAALVLLWAGFAFRNSVRWQRYVTSLRQEEGIVVIDAERHGSKYAVSGLRDPLSQDPARLLAAAGISPAKVEFHWEPYHSLSPRLSALRELAESKSRIEEQLILFDTGKATLEASTRDSVRAAAILAKSVMTASELAAGPAIIELIGHTDAQGTAESNDQLGLDRAVAVKSALQTLGVDERRLEVKSVGSREPLRSDGRSAPENRSVSFHVRTQSGR